MEDETGWDKYVNSTIYGVKDWNEYLENLKKTNGADFLEKIRIKNPKLSEPIVTGM